MKNWFQHSSNPGDEPGGNDDHYAEQRKRMVERQLRGRDITDPVVLRAMAKVPRHEFLPESARRNAYSDCAIPISHEQTISQPYIVAFMTQQLALGSGDRVLEIGTGTGYQTAVLAEAAAEVFSIEVIKPLADEAQDVLDRLHYTNVHLKHGDGSLGWAEHAPFDAVIVTCAPDRIPEPLLDQLGEDGRMIIPVGKSGDVQELYLLQKDSGSIREKAVLPVRFVPLVRAVRDA